MTMTPNQFNATLAKLCLSQVRFAKLVRVDDRSVRRWGSDGRDARKVPPQVVILLKLMVAGIVKPEDIEALK
jgi:hypothetical protein